MPTHKFGVGQRVVYKSPDDGSGRFHVASMTGTLVMHLNARDEHGNIKPITGTILRVLPNCDQAPDYDFAPDGWISNPSGWPMGFQAPEENLVEMQDESLRMPGTITDRMGNPVEET